MGAPFYLCLLFKNIRRLCRNSCVLISGLCAHFEFCFHYLLIKLEIPIRVHNRL